MVRARCHISAVVLGVALLLAGCLDGDETPQNPESDDAAKSAPGDEQISGPPVPVPVAAPEWHVGDAWTYDASYLRADPVTIKLIVVEVTGDRAVVGVGDPATAPVPLFTHWPPIGPIGMNDLSVTIHGTTFPLVQFPLEDGKTWTSNVRGETVTFTANRIEGLPAEEGPRFAVEGKAGDATRFSFVYDAAVGWFRTFDYTFPSETDVSHSFDLRQFERGYAGPAARLDWVDAFVGGRSSAGDPQAPVDTFLVPSDVSYVLAGVFHGGGPGVVGATFTAPDGDRFTAGGQRTGTEALRLEYDPMTGAAGSWTVDYSTAAQDFSLFAEALAVTETPVTITPS